MGNCTEILAERETLVLGTVVAQYIRRANRWVRGWWPRLRAQSVVGHHPQPDAGPGGTGLPAGSPTPRPAGSPPPRASGITWTRSCPSRNWAIGMQRADPGGLCPAGQRAPGPVSPGLPGALHGERPPGPGPGPRPQGMRLKHIQFISLSGDGVLTRAGVPGQSGADPVRARRDFVTPRTCWTASAVISMNSART